MTAVVAAAPTRRGATAAAGLPRSSRPQLVVIDSRALPGPSRRPVSPATYRRRRLVVAAVVVVLVSVAVVALHALAAGAGSGSLTAPGRSEAARVYVAAPGDTFWSIARRLQPHGDPRPLVSRMVAAHGGPVLHPGDRIALP